MKRQLIGTIGLAVLVAANIACTRVSPGYVGIKVVNGGSDRGVQDYPTQVGWVVYNPITTRVFEYPTFMQNAVWTHNTQEGNPLNEELTFTNKDQMLIAVDINVSYHLDPAKVPAFYVTFRNDDLDKFTHGYLRNVARDMFNEHAGQFAIEQIMGDNARFVSTVKGALQEKVALYGVTIDQLGIIGAPRPPAQVIANINAKVAAVQLAQQTENELRTVEAQAKKRVAEQTGEANAMIAQATGYAESLRVKAEAEAAYNEKMTKSMSPALLQKWMLDKWDGVLPQVNGSGASPFVTVTKQ